MKPKEHIQQGIVGIETNMKSDPGKYFDNLFRSKDVTTRNNT